MIDDHGRNRLPGDGYTLHACNLRPRSRGRITLTGDRATDKPRIEANYLGDPEGFALKVMVDCARISLDLIAPKANRKSDVEGKRGPEGLELGGRRRRKKK